MVCLCGASKSQQQQIMEQMKEKMNSKAKTIVDKTFSKVVDWVTKDYTETWSTDGGITELSAIRQELHVLALKDKAAVTKLYAFLQSTNLTTSLCCHSFLLMT